MEKNPLLPVGLCMLMLAGCTSSRPFPEGWPPPAAAKASGYPAPVGCFSNQGATNDPKCRVPTLSSLLFEDKLQGLDVDRICFRASDEGRRIRAKPRVGGVEIEAERFFTSGKDRSSPERWSGEMSKEYLDAYTVTVSALYTAGMFLPLATWGSYSLHLGEDGALLVRLKERELVELFYVLPVTKTEETWLRYPAMDAEE